MCRIFAEFCALCSCECLLAKKELILYENSRYRYGNGSRKRHANYFLLRLKRINELKNLVLRLKLFFNSCDLQSIKRFALHGVAFSKAHAKPRTAKNRLTTIVKVSQ